MPPPSHTSRCQLDRSAIRQTTASLMWVWLLARRRSRSNRPPPRANVVLEEEELLPCTVSQPTQTRGRRQSRKKSSRLAPRAFVGQTKCDADRAEDRQRPISPCKDRAVIDEARYKLLERGQGGSRIRQRHSPISTPALPKKNRFRRAIIKAATTAATNNVETKTTRRLSLSPLRR